MFTRVVVVRVTWVAVSTTFGGTNPAFCAGKAGKEELTSNAPFGIIRSIPD